MDIFTRKRFLAWVIALLIVLNVISLGTLWFTQIRHEPVPPRPGFDPENRREKIKDFLKRELQLSEEQIQRISNLQREYFRKSRDLQLQNHRLRQMLNRELFETKLDTNRVNELAAQIGRNEAAIEKIRYNHFYEIKSIFNIKQQRRFRQLFRRIMERTRPFGPPDAGRDMGRPPVFGNERKPPQKLFSP